MRYLVYIFLFLPIVGSSQFSENQQQQIDSLNGIINTPTSHDTSLARAYVDLSDILAAANLDTIIPLCQKAKFIAESALSNNTSDLFVKPLKLSLADALSNMGYVYSSRGDNQMALEYYDKSLKIYEEIGDKNSIANGLSNMGYAYYGLGDNQMTLEYWHKSLRIREEMEDKNGIAFGLNNIGAIYNSQGDVPKALDYWHKSLRIREELEDKNGTALSLSNIGAIYNSQGDITKALEYFNKSLKIQQEIGDKEGRAYSLNNMGMIYRNQGDTSMAFEHFNKSLRIYEEIGNNKGKALSLNNIGLIYFSQGDIPKALEYFNKSLNIKQQLGDKNGMAASLSNIGDSEMRQGKLGSAQKHLEKALALAQEVGSVKWTKNASKHLSSLYKKQGKYSDALKMYELHITIRDSMESIKNQKAVIRQEYKYQYEKQAATDSVKNAEDQKVKDAEILAQKAVNDRNEIKLKQGELERKRQNQRTWFLGGILALAVLFAIFIFNRFRVTKKQRDIIDAQKSVVESQKAVVEEQKAKVDEAYEQLEEKNTEILDSINYAKRIQSAILPPDKLVKEYLQSSFVLYKPKDIVAGDFYWMEPVGNSVLFAAADCTGHGVPGAMVSVVCNNGLNRSVREYGLTEPGDILSKTREIVIAEFEKSEEDVKDGMDIALCSLEKSSLGGQTLKYAGAHNPLWIIRKGASEVEEIKAHKQPIGKYAEPSPYPTHTIELNEGDAFYIFSDGYADQFGGEKGKKFKAANFKRLLLSIQNETIEKQRELIDAAFENWKGQLEQLDDVCVIGLRV